ncbi:hypothetical protein IRJ41_021147 [Triplophysa rosa]|uniref:Uncharacterized protein n=1 Tax=Triplophysa rosa TaxID=992332 RepID=A0A9W7TP68_TRIRA|nr:hypothetical protein IRJ41_021147 [Triplophysa rosa]
MDSKDARGSFESGGGDARCSCSSARRNVAAVFVIQSLLAAMCAAFSLYIFFSQTSGSHKQHDTGIYLDMTSEDEFTAIWNKSVDLKDKKKVVLSCAGPYMVYLWTCVRSYGPVKPANLTMQQGNKIVYQHTLRGNVCQETQSVVMLSQKREVTFKLEHFNTDIRRLHLGLHYMLGAQCFPDPPPV